MKQHVTEIRLSSGIEGKGILFEKFLKWKKNCLKKKVYVKPPKINWCIFV
jgi:hypothetical protein